MDDMKIHVTHIVQDLRMGGIERVIQTIVTSLDKSKYSAEVWGICSGGVIAERIAAQGIPVRVLSIRNCYSPSGIIKTARLLRKNVADIVHTHGYFADTHGRMAAILAGVPVRVTHLHSIFHQMSPVNVAIDRLLSRFTQGTITISEEVRQSYAARGYPMAAATLIFNGVDPRQFEWPRPLPVRNVIAIVASLTPHKGHRFLLEAFRTVRSRIPDAELWIAGSGPLRPELEAQASTLGITAHVRFFGETGDVPGLLCQASVAVLCSLREGLGLSAIEAMAAGLPVVASRIGGLPEVIEDGKTGILCPPGDSAAIGEALIRLLSDPVQAAAMGRAGRERFESKFTSKEMIRNLEGLYERLITARR